MADNYTSKRTAFVTGGSGFVGGKLIQRLVATGWDVRALARSPKAMTEVRALGATPVQGDMSNQEALRNNIDGSVVVFHVAAMFKLWGNRKDFNAVNVEGMRILVNAATASPSVRKVVYVSAAAVVMGDPKSFIRVDETAPTHQRGFAPYSSSKAEAEKILLASNNCRPGFETIAIRPPMIWGKGMPMLDHLVETVRKGQWQWVGGGSQAISTCHVDNLVDALLLAADGGQGGEAYFVADAKDGTLKGVMTDLLATRGVKADDKSVSFAMAWRLAGFMAFVWRLFGLKGEPPITRQLLQMIGKPFTVNTDKAQRILGYRPRVSWREGLDEMA
ncbi:NAD-dependent epimerase/dehydratase family protein [Asticcacaulis sp. ZE23SCel15]|uniref:NAD-dependent epimerase/dehydratase family protein n=1 Tax=Asticcacaulis sp. ZE23SCel15 TaxID=3059027 RepID=UPI00265E1BC0|nr:NAD-dependent epimerase/dehydratase family protein [Asticcacaulis sp. ZE23SCel15]WKL57490.1 NAD-dependent epimerase/dehydratase family protein [Asticcacaulis sp. ZE23SCel15]